MLPARAHGIRHAEVGEYEYIGELAVEPQKQCEAKKRKIKNEERNRIGEKKKKTEHGGSEYGSCRQMRRRDWHIAEIDTG